MGPVTAVQFMPSGAKVLRSKMIVQTLPFQNILGHVPSQPPGDVAVDVSEVPFVDVGEALRRGAGRGGRPRPRPHINSSVMAPPSTSYRLTCHG
jgi:hypothetical protein